MLDATEMFTHLKWNTIKFNTPKHPLIALTNTQVFLFIYFFISLFIFVVVVVVVFPWEKDKQKTRNKDDVNCKNCSRIKL